MDDKNTRLRNLTWEDYGISKARYKELRYFCLQYRDKRKQAKRGASREKLLKDIRIIEEAAMWAASASGHNKAWHLILRSVTEDIGYDLILGKYDFVPYTKTDFYAVRRAFFHRLDVLQENPESPENTGLAGSQKVGTN